MKVNEIIREGADFMAYKKEGDTWTYPKGFEIETPHRSNMAVRQFLSRVGLDPDFENSGPMEINKFIGAMSKHDNDREAKMYHDEAMRFKKEYPELTHVSFV
tara:strand:- start:107 stop:412 length:306 start_codon:yes stop_codon:yes gene_type:complete